MKHMISIADHSREEIEEIFRVSLDLKDKRKRGIAHRVLEGKSLAMIFQKSSTRTRVSFEVGMYQLGGTALFLSANDLQLGRGETIKDTALTLSRYVDGIMIRTFRHQDVLELAEYGSVPVINGLTDLLHPCQILGDLLTVIERRGNLDGFKAVFIGDGNNVANSWVNAAARLGFGFVHCPPQGYEPDAGILAAAREAGADVSIVHDPIEAVSDADLIYTDVWTSMGQEAEREERIERFKPYQVNAGLLSRAKADVMVMHCLPARRGEEITDEVMDGPNSVIFDQAENRLHAQKGIMAILMG